MLIRYYISLEWHFIDIRSQNVIFDIEQMKVGLLLSALAFKNQATQNCSLKKIIKGIISNVAHD